MSDGTPIIIKKKKVHGGHAHHGGSWKVAYADFVTAMMAFFMVMWIMGLSDATRTTIAGYFNDPLGFKNNVSRSHDVVPIRGVIRSRPSESKTPPQSSEQAKVKDSRQLAKLAQQLKSEMKSDASLTKLLKNVEISVTRDGLRIELVESTDAGFFDSGSATLRPAAQALLARIGPVLGRTGRKMILEGHTDSVPYPSEVYNNWDLSSDRANALRRALSADGVNGDQYAGVRALADTQLKFPAAPTDPRNRRVTILLPFKPLKETKLELPQEKLEDRLGADSNLKPAKPGIAPQ